jgi:hypothetical protein
VADRFPVLKGTEPDCRECAPHIWHPGYRCLYTGCGCTYDETKDADATVG